VVVCVFTLRAVAVVVCVHTQSCGGGCLCVHTQSCGGGCVFTLRAVAVVVCVFTLRARVLLSWGNPSCCLTNVVYPSVGVLLNYCIENYIWSNC
jgi:hypothetical protein